MDQLELLLQEIYGESLDESLYALLQQKVAEAKQGFPRYQCWSEKDVILITYGDSVETEGLSPLQSLHLFLGEYLSGLVSAVHILPFFPFSSDDGFSVIDYYQVNYKLGDWSDIKKLNQDFELMFDLVMNHCSRQSLWFNDFVNGTGEGQDYFIESDPKLDYSAVTRPRTSPLIVDVYTRQGLKHVWATFSDDQIDLNFANPKVLMAFVDIFIFYLKQGARFVRLDAVAFVWKLLGSNCIHLQQTHAIVKLLRWVMEQLDPNLILITETNVPHQENISYFGQGDEAHMVYQFALPPLLLHALNRGNGHYLTAWARDLVALPKGCNYFNFVASHDGIGVRAVEQIIPKHEIMDLAESVHNFGGFVSMKSNGDGTQNPYELNISLFDALQGTRTGSDQWQVERFLCSQKLLLSLQGIPGIYIHSLTATANDQALVEQTGRTRSINRHRWQRSEFETLLSQEHSAQAQVFQRYRDLLSLRKNISAFHPESAQRVYDCGDALFVLQRGDAPTANQEVDHQSLLAVFNLTKHPQSIDHHLQLPQAYQQQCKDLLSEEDVLLQEYKLKPYQVLWLVAKPDIA
ncbi:sugar phosphorylase [Agarivorans gilvus]|uniref:Sucrose phosphorylase n=1 Tax=Agarivorans gilvus TaxID=680279 RepID=A0ABQ1I0E4_9ALTE|nr:sugar phosphorylase [Agarivorans gilvus]GGA98166.1 sucrose phosphorylase [Agarivorans gilvus]